MTLTGPTLDGVEEKVDAFVRRLGGLWDDLPARTVPLRIEAFGPMINRNVSRDLTTPLAVQEAAIGIWTACVRPAEIERIGRQRPC